MKSIMQEASSIAKAIEQGWEQAGMPTDFSVKILEKPQKNFFGFTTHPAKVALYFDERVSSPRHDAQGYRQNKPRTARESHAATRSEQRSDRQVEQRQPAARHAESRSENRYAEPRKVEQRVLEPRQEQRRPEQRSEPVSGHRERAEQGEVVSRHEGPREGQRSEGQRQEAQWNEAMMSYAHEWLDTVLPESCGKSVAFTIEPNNLYLRITFAAPVLDNQEKEKRLFASLSLLILEALKRKFKVGLRRHKIILTNA